MAVNRQLDSNLAFATDISGSEKHASLGFVWMRGRNLSCQTILRAPYQAGQLHRIARGVRLPLETTETP